MTTGQTNVGRQIIIGCPSDDQGEPHVIAGDLKGEDQDSWQIRVRYDSENNRDVRKEKAYSKEKYKSSGAIIGDWVEDEELEKAAKKAKEHDWCW